MCTMHFCNVFFYLKSDLKRGGKKPESKAVRWRRRPKLSAILYIQGVGKHKKAQAVKLFENRLFKSLIMCLLRCKCTESPPCLFSAGGKLSQRGELLQLLIACQSPSSKTQGNQRYLSRFAKQCVFMSTRVGVQKAKNNSENRKKIMATLSFYVIW